MRTLSALALGMVLGVAVASAGVMAWLRAGGAGARGAAAPGVIESIVARAARSSAIPPREKARMNPIPLSEEAIADGLTHFADHCASCHANDGSGQTEMGRGLYPPAPDMRLPATQQLSDGELFYIIENGIRFTGMPGWGTGTADGEASTWRLVHFVRHLPRLTQAQRAAMTAMNPRSPEEVRQEIEEQRFLNEGVTP